MAEPDWIGAAVGDAWWSWDGREVYYNQQRQGAGVRDIVAIRLAGNGQPERTRVLDGLDRVNLDAARPVFNTAHTQMAFIRNGDVFVRNLDSGELVQLTRTLNVADDLQWSDEGALTWRSGNDWFGWTLAQGVKQFAALRADDAPDTAPAEDILRAGQLRLFDTLRRERERSDARRAQEIIWQRSDPTRTPPPVYLGKQVNIHASALSPDGRWLLVITEPKSTDSGRVGQMPRYINESGYEETEPVRTRVGRNPPPGQSLWLADMQDGTLRELKLDDLPGIADDPLAQLRREAGQVPLSGLRPVQIELRGSAAIDWNESSTTVAVMLHSVDNKDRWLVTVDPQTARVACAHHLTDPAWINWDYNEFGWFPGEEKLWLLSEHSGYSHLYVTTNTGRIRALTEGQWEVSSPIYSRGQFYFLCSRAAPGAYEVCQASASAKTPGDVHEITASGGGIERFVLSPDGTQLLLHYSSSYLPVQLALAAADAKNGALQPLTDTRSENYKAYDWLQPEYVQIPSRHGANIIYGKLYRPRQLQPECRYPIVLFVHGAGYLQNVTHRYPNYYREQMFHNLLVQRGFIVLDLDYRASKGYGRNWRTAIYRQMGHPELEDYLDGIDWLVQHQQGDRGRVGMYGGSYGGFLTLMALFREPGTFKAGAALRPVVDWRHYNHSYTSNILNVPGIDPQAYLKSSPIEYADGLQDHLLIAHGMIDDNVFYQDSVMLVQRLIELRKHDWDMASYPLERHGYVHADSWYDQYRRVLDLFERAIPPSPPSN